MPTLTPKLLTWALTEQLREHSPRWEKNQNRHVNRLTAEKYVDAWPPFMPYPSNRDQLRKVAALIKADKFRIEDVADIVAPVRI